MNSNKQEADVLLANLRNAVWNKQTVTIAGGEFRPEEISRALAHFETVQKEATAHFGLWQHAIEQRDELLEHLSYLLHIMNKDKDGSYFICQEAEDSIQDAWAAINQVNQ